MLADILRGVVIGLWLVATGACVFALGWNAAMLAVNQRVFRRWGARHRGMLAEAAVSQDFSELHTSLEAYEEAWSDFENIVEPWPLPQVEWLIRRTTRRTSTQEPTHVP